MMEQKQIFISVAEAARRLGYCTESVRRLIKAGQLPASVLPNGQYRIKVKDLDSMLQPIGRQSTDD